LELKWKNEKETKRYSLGVQTLKAPIFTFVFALLK